MTSRKSSAHQIFNPGLLKSPLSSHSGYRSADRFSSKPGLPLHPNDLGASESRYSIAFVPGMSEHQVNTGNTLQDAQLKVVLFACEVERLNTQNYNLVKENEILKAQGIKADREIDLENKLGIVLAENEKLQQVVNELHDVIQRQRVVSPNSRSRYNEFADNRVAELMQSLEEWQMKYNSLEKSLTPENSALVQKLEAEKAALTERLARQERDLEALRARLNLLDKGPAEGRFSQQKVTQIVMENERLKKELETMRLQYGNANALQLKLKDYDDKIRILLYQNEKLNQALDDKIRAQQALKAQYEHDSREASPLREIKFNGRPHSGIKEKEKNTGMYIHETENKLQEVTKDNVSLTQENERLNGVVLKMRETIEQLQQTSPDSIRPRLDLVLKENEKLNQLLGDKLREIEDLKVQLRENGSSSARREHLNAQVNNLLAENRRLNDAMADKLREIDVLRIQAREGEGSTTKLEALEEKIILVTTENGRLNNMVDDKIREIAALKRQIDENRNSVGRQKDLAQQVSRLLEENNRLNEMVDTLHREVEELKSKNRGLEHSGVSAQQKEQLNSLTIDNRRLNDVVADKVRESETLRRRITDLELTSTTTVQLREQMTVLTAERDRLSILLDERVREVEALRSQIEDSNRRVIGASTEYAKENEVLKRKIIELELGSGNVQHFRDQISALTNDKERLNRGLMERQLEVDTLRRQVDELKSNVKIDQLTFQVNNLSDENRKLKEVVSDRTKENDTLRKRVVELEAATGYDSHTRNQIAHITEERDRLHHLIVSRAEELEDLKKQLNDYKLGNPRMEQVLVENKRLTVQVIEKGGEVDRIKKRVTELEACAHMIDDLQEKIIFITTENERLNKLLSDRARDNSMLKIQTDDTRASRGQNTSVQLDKALDDNNRLNAILSEKVAENEALRRKLMDLENEESITVQLRNEVRLVSEERDRVNSLLYSKTQENESLLRQMSELKGASEKIDHLTRQVTALIDENKRLNDLVTEKTREADLLRRKVLDVDAGIAVTGELREQVNHLTTERDNATKALSDKIVEVENVKRELAEVKGLGGRVETLVGQVNTLLAENDRLNEVVAARTGELELLRKKLHEADTEVSTLRATKDQIAAVHEERAKMTRKLSDKDVEADELREKLEVVEVQKEALAEENRSLNEILNDKTRETEVLRERVIQIEADTEAIDQLRRQVNQLIAEKEEQHHQKEHIASQVNALLEENRRLNNLVLEKAQQLQEAQTEVSNLQATKVQIAAVHEEKERIIRKLSNKDVETDELREKLEVVEVQKEALAEENRSLNEILNDKTRETEVLREKVVQMEAGTDAIDQLRNQVNTLLAEKEEQHRHIEHITLQVNSLLEENRSLNVLVSERTREIDLLRTKSTEADESAATVAEAEKANLLKLLSERTHDVETLRKQLEGLQSDISHIKLQCTSLLDENNWLKGQVSSKEKEIEGLKTQNSTLTEEKNKLDDLVVSKAGETKEWKKKASMHEESLATVQELRAKVATLESDIERLTHLLSDKDNELNRLHAQEHSLLQENGRLNGLLIEKERENDSLKATVAEAEAIKSKHDELHHKLGAIVTEHTQLNSALIQKQSEIDDLKQNIGETPALQARLTAATEEAQHLASSLEAKSKEADDWKNKFFEAQRDAYQTGELKTRIQSLQAENERLNGLMSERFRELDEIRRKNAELQANSGLVDELRTKLVLVNQENDRVNNILQAKLRELETLKQELGNQEIQTPRIGELEERLRSVIAERDRLNEVVEMKLEEVEELKKRLAQQEQQRHQHHQPVEAERTDDVKMRLALVTKENERLAEILQEKVMEIEQFRTSTLGGNRNVEELQARIELLMSENERLDNLLQDKLQEIEELRSTDYSSHEIRGPTPVKAEDKKSTGVGVRASPSPTSREQVPASEAQQLAKENERLRDSLARAEHEVRALGLRLRQLTQDDEKFKLDEDYRQLLEDQMKDNTRRFAAERQALEGQILGLNQRIFEYEERLRILGEDNRKLSSINEKRIVELDDWQHRYEQLERQRVSELEALRREADHRLQQEVDLSTKHLTEGPEAVIGKLRREKLAIEERANILNREVEKMKGDLNEALGQLDMWRNKYTELENLRGQEIRELRKQFENFRKTNVDNKEFQVKFTAERTAYETQLLQWQQKANDLENQVEMLINENERMIALSLERLKEVEFWKRKYSQCDENYALEISDLNAQLEMFRSNNYDVKQLAIKYSAEKAADQSQIKQLKQMNENYAAELEKLYELMNQRKIDFDTQARQNEELRRLYERLAHQSKEHGSEGSISADRFETLQTELIALAHSRDQYKRQAERNSVELTRKNKELIEKIQELDVLKVKYEEALANCQALNAQLFTRLGAE